jgi:uncharacterized protein (DUF1697 family)
MPKDERSKDLKGAAYLALLRGINVGGKNILPMKQLADIFMSAGCSAVSTYIQSGNVLFRAKADLAEQIPELISKAIEKKFQISVPIIVRSHAQMQKLLQKCPFTISDAKLESLHIAFLSQRPSKTMIAKLDPSRSEPDQFSVQGTEIFMKLYRGISGTKLSNQYFDSTLKCSSTIRNWNTSRALLDKLKAI